MKKHELPIKHLRLEKKYNKKGHRIYRVRDKETMTTARFESKHKDYIAVAGNIVGGDMHVRFKFGRFNLIGKNASSYWLKEAEKGNPDCWIAFIDY